MENFSPELIRAQTEAFDIQKKAKEGKDDNEVLSGTDYENAEFIIDKEGLFMKEGREKWLEMVKSYWANHNVFSQMEHEAYKKEGNEKTIETLVKSFVQGVGEVHHRLQSTIGAIRDTLNNTKFYSPEQLHIYNEIEKNSDKNGKIERYSKNKQIDSIHPVYKIYDDLLENSSDEEFALLINDAKKAGRSAALSTSEEELISWFYWANGQEFIKEGRKIPIALLKFAEFDPNNKDAEKQKLAKEALRYMKLFASMSDDREFSTTELAEAKKRSEPAMQKWVELLFSDDFKISPAFKEYLESNS